MKQRIVAIALAATALLFAVLAAWTAIGFLSADSWLAKIIGASVLLIILMGVWSIIREIRFGTQTQKLARILEAEGGLPEDNLPRVRGRIDREAADAQFEIVKAETQADPKNWRHWFRLSLAYDAAGDRKRARSAMRDSITLFNEVPRSN